MLDRLHPFCPTRVTSLVFYTLATLLACHLVPSWLSGATVQAQASSPLSVVGGVVSLGAQVDRGAVLLGSDGLVHVAVDVAVPENAGEVAERRPTDMLVVLDISGSMSGEKLMHAKRALHDLLDRLTEDDRFALVTYESQARLVAPFTPIRPGAVARFHRVVNRLETLGGTNMSEGLDLALRQLRGSRAMGRSARVLLLSDGHANEGDSTVAGLSARARRVVQFEDVMSTMGIGDDFNEDLMTRLADTGTGNFYYLSRVALLGRFFDAELRAASQTVASAVELHFRPGAGVELLDVGGYPIEHIGAERIVRPGNLYAGQTRRLWITLRVPTDAQRELKLGQLSLHYRRGDTQMHMDAPTLPPMACVDDTTRFEQSISRPLWEDYVAGEEFQKTQLALGRAIGEGNAADVDREHAKYESNRRLAIKLGSRRVLQQLDALEVDAAEAKKDQKTSSSERRYRSKHKKAAAHFRSRADAYNDDPLSGL